MRHRHPSLQAVIGRVAVQSKFVRICVMVAGLSLRGRHRQRRHIGDAGLHRGCLRLKRLKNLDKGHDGPALSQPEWPTDAQIGLDVGVARNSSSEVGTPLTAMRPLVSAVVMVKGRALSAWTSR